MGGTRWVETQQSRLDSEKGWTSLFAGISLSGIFLNPVVIVLGIALFTTSYARRRALNEGNREWAERRLFLTNPIIELCSIAIVYITIATIVQEYFPTDFRRSVLLFSVICLGISLAVVLVERFAHGKYLAWWGNRAFEKSGGEEDGFWKFAAIACHNFSGYQPTPDERKRVWSRQRGNPGGVTPMMQKQPIPTPRLAWVITVINHLLNPGRVLSFIVGLILFSLAGLTTSNAALFGIWIYLTAALLADNVKYLYLYEPLKSGFFEYSTDTVFDRLVVMVRAHWVATITAFVILWAVLA